MDEVAWRGRKGSFDESSANWAYYPGVGARRLAGAGGHLVGLGIQPLSGPYNIAAGGVSGIAILINHFTGWNVSVMYLVMNLPLFVLGFIYLGRWRFLIGTAIVVMLFTVCTAWFDANLPHILAQWPITDSVLLSAIYAGLVGGSAGGYLPGRGHCRGHRHRRPHRAGEIRTVAQPDLSVC